MLLSRVPLADPTAPAPQAKNPQYGEFRGLLADAGFSGDVYDELDAPPVEVLTERLSGYRPTDKLRTALWHTMWGTDTTTCILHLAPELPYHRRLVCDGWSSRALQDVIFSPATTDMVFVFEEDGKRYQTRAKCARFYAVDASEVGTTRGGLLFLPRPLAQHIVRRLCEKKGKPVPRFSH